jgi:uncharacterized protein with von Willebrand factor type A (vWA) domain
MTGAASTSAGSAGTGPPEEGAERLAVAFARVLRGVGLEVPTTNVVLFAEALAAVGLDHRVRVHAAATACFLRSPADRARFEACFAAFWDGRAVEAGAATVSGELPVTVVVDLPDEHEPDAADQDQDEGDRTDPVLHLRWSATEVLRHKDFATCTPAELAQLQRLLPVLRRGGATRRSRRPVRSRRGSPDLRRTVRRALRNGGDPVALLRRGPGQRPRRLVLLVDVSGSMAAYARTLVRFAHAAAIGRRRVEVFTLGTRLTRLTRELATHDPDVALEQAGRAVPDWSGGTRLGDSLKRFNDEWGVRGLARGAVVVVLSDGWDRGDPAVLGRELARLRRVAHRIVWVNPLKAAAGYQPLAGGMAAALPHVDAFLEGHSLAALEQLAADLERA